MSSAWLRFETAGISPLAGSCCKLVRHCETVMSKRTALLAAGQGIYHSQGSDFGRLGFRHLDPRPTASIHGAEAGIS